MGTASDVSRFDLFRYGLWALRAAVLSPLRWRSASRSHRQRARSAFMRRARNGFAAAFGLTPASAETLYTMSAMPWKRGR